MTIPVGSSETLPKAAPYRHGRQKYAWNTMKPGQWFKFPDNVKPTSARVQASAAGNSWGMKFHVFAGVDGGLYCRRVDGLDASERFLKVERDEYGNPVTPQAPLHQSDEPTPKPVGRGRVYGEGVAEEPMPGETIYYGGAGSVTSPVDDDVPFEERANGGDAVEEDEV